MTTISVIIPVYNSKATLGRAIMSVVNEPLVSEILIVDDGSTDASIQIVEDLANKYSNIRFLHHSNWENKGASASRNLGIAHATSDWIQFLDADDEILAGKLSVQVNLINPELALIIGNSIHVFPDGRKHFRKSDQDIWKGLIRSKLGDTCANLWNKKYLLEISGWNETLSSSQEYDLMFRILCHNPNVVFDNNYSTLIYKTENSISTNSQKRIQRLDNWLVLRENIRSHLIRQGNFGIWYQYYWSGAVGKFCELNDKKFPSNLNILLFLLYKMEILSKKKMHQIIKSND